MANTIENSLFISIECKYKLFNILIWGIFQHNYRATIKKKEIHKMPRPYFAQKKPLKVLAKLMTEHILKPPDF